MLPLLERWLKHAALEVQEYVFLTRRAFHGIFTRPIYRHDIVEQFDQIGAGSLTVVLLSGLFTGAALASQSGLTAARSPAQPRNRAAVARTPQSSCRSSGMTAFADRLLPTRSSASNAR